VAISVDFSTMRLHTVVCSGFYYSKKSTLPIGFLGKRLLIILWHIYRYILLL
jgi:hypothetical protein